MKLNRKFRMAAGTAAITFSAALAMPAIASAGGHHSDYGDDHASSSEHRGDFADHRGDVDHNRGHADHRGDAPCPPDKAPKAEAKAAPAPAAKTTSYPTQSATGSVAVPGSSDSNLVIVTLAATAALGSAGFAVRRATSR